MLNPVVSARYDSVGTTGSSSLDVSGFAICLGPSCAIGRSEGDAESKLAEGEVVVGDSTTP